MAQTQAEIDELIAEAREWPRELEGNLINNLADALAGRKGQTQADIDLVARSTVDAIVQSIRQNCTPSWQAVQAGGDVLVRAVADWVENPPEWLQATWADQARKSHAARQSPGVLSS